MFLKAGMDFRDSLGFVMVIIDRILSKEVLYEKDSERKSRVV